MVSYRMLSGILFVSAIAAPLTTQRSAFAQGYPPAQAAAKMTAADGLNVKLFAAEPEVRQPILVKMDDRGRLWTIQYLQYPNPAGLKRVKVDRWSRTVYDRVPKPPPHGPRGADKITILEDTDGDGRADKVKDFVDGLNLTTGVEFGHGGVYVIQVPYLLFYPDRDRDDVPDADPEVLLTGFGMEDAQSFANHLTWGPDGWLYGLNGSTTTCRIRGIEFQQGCWRYHPVTKEFELFCEGGGNLYGLTFDERGNLFYSSNGGLFYHAVQGGYYEKRFDKHGPLHNLYTYGHFRHVKNSGVRGTPTTGGTVYLGTSFPAKYRGAFICGNFLGHSSSWWRVKPRQTTVEASFGGLLFDSHDSWFGPTDMCLGAGGSMYVSDFHDRRTGHPDPDANWDRSNGRIYKIEAEGSKPAAPFDLAKLSGNELVDLLNQSNRWFSARARVELAHRRDKSIVPRLRKLAMQQDDSQLALEALWALHVTAGLDEPTALKLLGHPDDYVRFWTVRLLGDARKVSPAVSERFIRLAASEPSAIVRQQLAASAKRLPGADALPIVGRLLLRDEDAKDLRIPLLLWWAVESKAISNADAVLKLFTDEQVWQHPLSADCAQKLVRRYAADGSKQGYAACMTLIESTPKERLPAMHQALAKGLAERETGFAGVGHGTLFLKEGADDESTLKTERRKFVPATPELKDFIARHWNENRDDGMWLPLALRCDVEGAYGYLKSVVGHAETPADRRVAMLSLFSKFGRPDSVPLVLPLVNGDRPEQVRLAALDTLNRFDSPQIGKRLIQLYPEMPAPLKSRTRDLLFSRPATALQFLQLVDSGKVASKDVPVAQLRQVTVHEEDAVNELVQKHWGKITAGTPEEKLASMRRFGNDLRAGKGDAARGLVLFEKNCAICHQLFGKGAKIGPDLTSTSRKDTPTLLANLVDPSAVIRRDYLNSVIITDSGRVLTGLITKQDGGSVTVADAKGKFTTLARDEIEEIRTSPLSLMPENQLEKLKPQERRDLFAYLQSNGPESK